MWALEVTPASVQDRTGAWALLNQLEPLEEKLAHIYADAGYRGFLQEFVHYVSDWTLEIVEKPSDQKGFAVQPKRWIVERTFAWMMRFRRLIRDYEYLVEVSKATVQWAMVAHMLRRLTKT
jgi:transposase